MEGDTRTWHSRPIHTQRHVKIICIGAGASGLLLAYKLQRNFSNVTMTVYEKNPEVSGTWWENRYPGCACDVPAHNYTWSFEPKLDWSAVYASSSEIFDYFNTFTTKHGLHQYVRIRHKVTAARWDEQAGGYHVTVTDLAAGTTIEDTCDILVNASGILNNWKWPDVPGLSDFKGTVLHTANWDITVDLTAQRVVLIGNGSSGIQVLPSIQPRVAHVTTFIRSPTYVSPVQGLEQHVYSDQEKQDFAQKPGALTAYRRDVETGLNALFSMFLRGSTMNTSTREYMVNEMRDRLDGHALADQLIPDWSLGCRRLTPGIGYLEAMAQPNVTTVRGGVSCITTTGCISDSDSKEYPCDVIICATGFDTSFHRRFPLLGKDGLNLQEIWAEEPKSYLGLAAAGFPNYLMFLGPNCPIGNGPVLIAIEAQADYICKLIDYYQTHNIKSFVPKQLAVDDFVAHKDAFMRNTVWADTCKSWYKASPDAPITALWPGSSLHYIEAIMELRLDDYEIEYSGNRFAWLGNGFSQTEMDDTADWAFYIREHDDGPWLSRARRREVLTKSGTITDRKAVDWTGEKKPSGKADGDGVMADGLVDQGLY